MDRKKPSNKKSHKAVYRVLTVIAVIMLVVGIGLVLFPVASNWYGKQVATGVADDFDTRVKNIQQINSGKADKKTIAKNSEDKGIDYTKIDINALYSDSKAYNKKVKDNQYSMLISEEVFEKPALYLSKYGIYDGVYGYVDIPAIDLKVPIYLGVQNNHMSYGVAHLTYTSLPIGDKGSKCVLAGHTGYVGRIFFDNIRQLNVGDTIKIVNYWGTINYTVTGNKVIDPKEADDLFIRDDTTSIALVTCITNGKGGFDRYIVFGEKK